MYQKEPDFKDKHKTKPKKMPSRLEVPSLESIALNNIPSLVATLVNTLNKQENNFVLHIVSLP